jgi:polysaccharide biosynthesis PFTS motif protein
LIYRPIWTISCKTSRVVLLNYAASHSHFKTSHGYPPLDLGHAIINWPEIVLWNESYSEWFKATQTKKSKILTMSPVWFGDSASDLAYLKNDTSKKIAIFDVSPFRPTFANITGSFPQYRTLKNGILFLDDIYELCVKFGIQVLWKRKRQLNKIHHKRYVSYSNEFIKRPGVVEIDPDCAATRLIKYSDAVISMPFTSTAFHANYLGKKSCFYDATGVLYKHDRGVQGLMLLSGKEELAEWLTSHFG